MKISQPRKLTTLPPIVGRGNHSGRGKPLSPLGRAIRGLASGEFFEIVATNSDELLKLKQSASSGCSAYRAAEKEAGRHVPQFTVRALNGLVLQVCRIDGWTGTDAAGNTVGEPLGENAEDSTPEDSTENQPADTTA